MHHQTNFRADRSNRLQRHNRFSIFQNGGRPLSWIFKTLKFYLPVYMLHAKFCADRSNFAEIGLI